MPEFPQEYRQSLAHDLRRYRAIEKQTLSPESELKNRRNRSAELYVRNLQGLEATLEYASHLPVKTVVDLGAGTSLAAGQLAKSPYGKNLEFIGTGLVPDPAIKENLGSEHYRLTPAETMRGFKPGSVGAFISVFGPLYYSDFQKQVFDKLDELLVPEGIIKLSVMEKIPGSTADNIELIATRIQRITDSFKEHGYDLAMSSWSPQPDNGVRVFLGIKPIDTKSTFQDGAAESIMRDDFATQETMRETLRTQFAQK